ncbi:helicase-related protein [Desulfocastanea catecholica]
MAWLARTIPQIPGSGIVYTLTKRDADRVTEWLQVVGISAKAYYSGVAEREELERELLNNDVKVLVATVALGMGFDKPDLGFVIHFQRPSSVVHYYQQVGRAGRAVDEAYGVLLSGTEDDRIADFFIRSAFPPQRNISEVIRVLDEADTGLSVPSMEGVLNLRHNQIESTINYLAAESPAPIVKVGSKWNVTATASTYRIDQDHIDAISDIRRHEQQEMRNYMQNTGCLMAFLQDSLDDPEPENCGKCQNCAPESLLDESYDEDLANKAGLFLRRSYQPIKAKKKWPPHNPLPTYSFSGFIRDNLIASEGRALSLWRDAGWGELVYKGKYEDDHFSDELVAACVEMVGVWDTEQAPGWVTCIPSNNHPNLVPNFAKRLADALGLQFVDCIEKVQNNQQQKTMENSFKQARNLDGVFKVNLDPGTYPPCLLIDDMVDSGWTFTVAAALLRQIGCTAVYPLALALNSSRMD